MIVYVCNAHELEWGGRAPPNEDAIVIVTVSVSITIVIISSSSSIMIIINIIMHINNVRPRGADLDRQESTPCTSDLPSERGAGRPGSF